MIQRSTPGAVSTLNERPTNERARSARRPRIPQRRRRIPVYGSRASAVDNDDAVSAAKRLSNDKPSTSSRNASVARKP
ncbi:hypothetical protein PTI98_009360 [Pleurotus ostreatus]|nr:hypothetical protein PTI98_009360 [Pleurotus ostreatus]